MIVARKFDGQAHLRRKLEEVYLGQMIKRKEYCIYKSEDSEAGQRLATRLY